MIWRACLWAILCLSVWAYALPSYTATVAIPTITLPPHPGHPANLTQLLEERLNDGALLQLQKRQSGVIGTGICLNTMQEFTCDPSHHEENRCAGDEYSYCICAGSASLPGRDPQGLWLNTAWGPGCYACSGKGRGYLFDGTCNGDGTGGRGQFISEILRTLTITLTEWTYSTLSPTHTRKPTDDDNGPPPRAPSTTVTRIVTVTNTSLSRRRSASSVRKVFLGVVIIAVGSVLL